ISTGKKAFDGIPFDAELSSKICDENEQPEFGEGTPEFDSTQLKFKQL
ncbi:17672_t:CDS:2, partial [Racocetra fulgida]